MKMKKTRDSFRELEHLSPQEVNCDVVLGVMQDILQDVHDESMRDFKDMEFSKSALERWRNLSNALLSVQMDSSLSGLSDRSRQRVESYRKQLEDFSSKSDDVRREMREIANEEQELTAQLHKYEEELARLKERKRKAAEISDRIEAVKQEISSIQNVSVADLTKLLQQLTLEKEEKQKRSTDYTRYTVFLRTATEENEKLKANIDSTQSMIEQKQREKTEFEMLNSRKLDELSTAESSYEELIRTVSDLDSRISSCKDKISACNEAVMNKQIELKKQTSELNLTKASLQNTEEQIAIAKAKQEELAVQNRLKQSALEAIIAEIDNLQSAAPDLQKRIEDQKLLLEKERSSQEDEIQRMSLEVSDLNKQIGAAAAKLSTLLSEKTAVEKKLQEDQRQLEEAEDAMAEVRKEIDELGARRIKLKSEQDALFRQKEIYLDDIKKFRDFFDSEDCRRTRAEIDSYGRVIDEYNSAVATIFQTKNAFVNQLEDLSGQYREMRDRLRNQLTELQRQYQQLSKDYIDVIIFIEEKVKL